MPVIKTKLQIVQTPVRLVVSRSADLRVAWLLLKYLIAKVLRIVPEIDWFSISSLFMLTSGCSRSLISVAAASVVDKKEVKVFVAVSTC